jgi:molybdate transport system substrate-binding protein
VFRARSKQRPWRQWRRVRLLLVIIPISLWVTAFRAQTHPPVRVAAAADLEPVLPELLVNYQRQSGEHVEASFASSATLATQIENGAPFDVFLSADMALPERIVRDGFAAPGSTARPYARGTLVLWTRNQSGLGPLNMQVLQSPQVRSVAIANPQSARHAYQPILQGEVALKGGANAKGATAFLKYLHSASVAQRLHQGGLAPVQ